MIIISKNGAVYGELGISLGGFFERLERMVSFSLFLQKKLKTQNI